MNSIIVIYKILNEYVNVCFRDNKYISRWVVFIIDVCLNYVKYKNMMWSDFISSKIFRYVGIKCNYGVGCWYILNE